MYKVIDVKRALAEAEEGLKSITDLYRDECEELLEKLRDLLVLGANGTLREEDVSRHVTDPCDLTSIAVFYWRRAYTSSVSWSIWTVEYRQSLGRLVRALARKENPQVLEVCAGMGRLGSSFENWVCTDSAPGGDSVEALDAMEAIEKYSEADVLFTSWVPYTSQLDYQLACRWVGELRKPMVIVGEGRGGCTGNVEFWGRTRCPEGDSEYDTIALEVPYSRVRPDELIPSFKDVPQWDGMHDYTTVVLPLEER